MSFWVSVRGRRVVRVLAAVGVSGAFLRYYLPNTHYLHTTKEITQLYRKGDPVPLPENVTHLIQQVQLDLHQQTHNQNKPHHDPQTHNTPTHDSVINPPTHNQNNPNPQTHGHNLRQITAYTIYGYDLFHAGSMTKAFWENKEKEKTKAIIGIPQSFAFTSEHDFDTRGILINQQQVPWSTPAGQSLKQSLVLSPEAKKFAICREMMSVNTNEPFILGTLAATNMLMMYLLASGVNRTQNFYVRPRSLRLTWYALVGSFGAAMWTLIKDSTTLNHENSADQQAASVSPSYTQGGLEFYEKILQRNIALRELMGKEGENMYTAFGNEQVFIRTRNQPYTLRRDYMKNLVESN
ncbi:hypothetical protein Pmani_022423 [Petrolisthes manimaculis]|uniref:Transmembrane protein 177 n=1 Tax=Petrolisthes manimaculis TaxID=1843537 RepID=A0AAE1PE19_9EUCA|nr:hypothetical protein Pmani_022423 [Petrolisthes manimaculis]